MSLEAELNKALKQAKAQGMPWSFIADIQGLLNKLHMLQKGDPK